MTTRLNKDMIEAIIASVIKDTTIPAEIAALKQELRERATAFIRAQVPPALMELSKQHPREWFHWLTDMYVSGASDEQNPLSCLGERNYLVHHNIEIEPTPWPDKGFYRYTSGPFDDLRERAEDIAHRRNEIHGQLRAYLLSRRTVEAAVKDMPELEPHMTVKPEKTGALVAASNVLAALVGSGFSQSAAQQKV